MDSEHKLFGLALGIRGVNAPGVRRIRRRMPGIKVDKARRKAKLEWRRAAKELFVEAVK